MPHCSFAVNNLCLVTTSIWLVISFQIISKHFKMYITINDVKGEKTLDLSYPIHSKKEITVVSMHISNYQILLHRSMEFLLKMGKKIVLNKGVYMDKELNSLIGTELKSKMLDSCNDIQRTNKLVNGTKITISLNELDNSDNLEDGNPTTPYLCILWQVLNILRISNPNPPI